MNNYDKISNDECINCDGKLINVSTLNKELKECSKCRQIYYRPDDMGPGCWQQLGKQTGLKPNTHQQYLQIFKLNCEGFGIKEIANKLFISIPAVHTAFNSLRKKYGATTNSQLALTLKQKGII